MSDEQNPDEPKTAVEAVVEHAVEALVYAPIGLLFEGASLLPQLVEKGRNQVTMARMLGKFAVDQGRTEATKAATKLQDQAAGVLELIGGSLTPAADGAPHEAPSPGRSARSDARRAPKAPGSARAAARRVSGAESAVAVTTPAPAASSAADAPDAASLAIPDYDGLSASHVVNRLAGLSSEELEAVRSYEAAHRGRKTILSKVAQLTSS